MAKEIVLRTEIRGDWEYCPDYIDESSIVYSLGVGDSIEFDNEIIKLMDAKFMPLTQHHFQ